MIPFYKLTDMSLYWHKNYDRMFVVIDFGVIFVLISVSKALFVDMSICCLHGNQSELQIEVDNSNNKWHCFIMS